MVDVNESGRICNDVPNLKIGKSVPRIQYFELTRRKQNETTTGSADPERTVLGEIKRAQAFGGQSIGLLVNLGDTFAFLPAHQSILARSPNDPVTRLRKGSHATAIH